MVMLAVVEIKMIILVLLMMLVFMIIEEVMGFHVFVVGELLEFFQVEQFCYFTMGLWVVNQMMIIDDHFLFLVVLLLLLIHEKLDHFPMRLWVVIVMNIDKFLFQVLVIGVMVAMNAFFFSWCSCCFLLTRK